MKTLPAAEFAMLRRAHAPAEKSRVSTSRWNRSREISGRRVRSEMKIVLALLCGQLLIPHKTAFTSHAIDGILECLLGGSGPAGNWRADQTASVQKI
jgi:hypothetical protein